MTTVRARDDQPGTNTLATSASPEVRSRRGTGLLMALASGAAFATSGTFGDGLLRAGWSPGAAVLARITVAALVLTPFALAQLRGQRGVLRRGSRQILAYGLFGVLGCTFFYFYSIETIPVGIGLLLEYTAAFMVVGWLWVRHGQRPRRLTIAGTVVAIGGLALMAGITGSGGVSMTGFSLGLVNAACMTVFMFVCDRPQSASAAQEAIPAAVPDGRAAGASSPEEISPVVLSWAGICVGVVALAILGAAHVVPMAANTRNVVFIGNQVSWLVPVVAVGVLSTAVAYIAAVAAVRSLGAKLATFVGMSEVLFSAAFAWLMLGQVPTPEQFAGGALIMAGVVLIRIDER